MSEAKNTSSPSASKSTSTPASTASAASAASPSNDDVYAAIPRAKFHRKVHAMYMAPPNDPISFEQQLEALQAATEHVKVHQPNESDAIKNRYINILPADEYRVKLTGDTYINASWILDIGEQKTSYIATQAPVPESFNDFWQMIWEQKCQMVVMLTKEIENSHVKADSYWPRLHNTAKFGGLEVTLDEETETKVMITRKFTIKSGADKRSVTQIQYLQWPDHGVPQDYDDLIELYKAYRKTRNNSTSDPVVVHCSAGVGRSGVFTLIDIILDYLSDVSHTNIDIFSVLTAIRIRRPGSIQNVDQYAFCFHFIDHCIQNKLFGLSK